MGVDVDVDVGVGVVVVADAVVVVVMKDVVAVAVTVVMKVLPLAQVGFICSSIISYFLLFEGSSHSDESTAPPHSLKHLRQDSSRNSSTLDLPPKRIHEDQPASHCKYTRY